ncbi:hypothetical protein quinque_009594 [Culex quinquefasciatus]
MDSAERKLLSPILKDRAGAEAISSVNAVESELKERHGRTNIEQMESDHQQLLNLASLQGQRLAHMREKLTEHEAMINAMKRTVSARETSFSEELARGVTDSNDDQHA